MSKTRNERFHQVATGTLWIAWLAYMVTQGGTAEAIVAAIPMFIVCAIAARGICWAVLKAFGLSVVSPEDVAYDQWVLELRRTEYAEYLASSEWNAKAQRVRERAGYRCQLCSAAGRLEVHHRTYANIFNEGPDDLIALCSNCHRKFHGIG